MPARAASICTHLCHRKPPVAMSENKGHRNRSPWDLMQQNR